ncbi:PREDICTED: uncharacterized protein LOC105558753 [Vollenhovia emeryi]|uniref:uncharacterized protein LOC105558753 n=1 Tax=Vollenhovia emeryi TaxID=411798 RepID=UPI0005F4168D|nr:PREDICTED: uncharacterized protein LOC105558753 [Vollenhovia emeryi]
MGGNVFSKPLKSGEQTNSPNKSTDTVKVPPKFATKDDFIATWFSWKKKFFVYLKSIDEARGERQMLGIMLLNHMGPIGQEIHGTVVFYDTKPMEDLNVLIKKFDMYCIYGDKKRDREDIDKYTNDLKSIAIANMNCVDPALVVKEKIIQDICAQRFTGIVTFLPGLYGGKLIPYLRSLELDGIILFWKQCEMAQNMN